jgi:hypothetical protein
MVTGKFSHSERDGLDRHYLDVGGKGDECLSRLLASFRRPRSGERTTTAGEGGPAEPYVIEVGRGDAIVPEKSNKGLRDHVSDDVTEEVVVDNKDAHVVASSGSSRVSTNAA